LQDELETKFGKHLNTIKTFYCAPRKTEPEEQWVHFFKDATTLDLQ
jgi:hypothetical protein